MNKYVLAKKEDDIEQLNHENEKNIKNLNEKYQKIDQDIEL